MDVCIMEYMFVQLFCFSFVAQKYNREKFKEFVNTLAGIKTDEVRYNFQFPLLIFVLYQVKFKFVKWL